MIVVTNEKIDERNAKLLIPPEGELIAKDGRRFKIRKWRPCMEVNSVFSIEVEMIEAEECEKK